MKQLVVVALSLLLASAAVAQQEQKIDAAQIQKLLQQAQQHGGGRVKINTNTIMAAFAMHGCLQEKIGDDGIKRLGAWGTQLNKQVKPLCAAGKRDEAMRLQTSYAKNIMKTAEYKGVRACADQHKDVLDDPQFTEIRAVALEPDRTDKHICDYQKS